MIQWIQIFECFKKNVATRKLWNQVAFWLVSHIPRFSSMMVIISCRETSTIKKNCFEINIAVMHNLPFQLLFWTILTQNISSKLLRQNSLLLLKTIIAVKNCIIKELSDVLNARENRKKPLVIYKDNKLLLLCCPELMPQMVGGLAPPGVDTEKESVRHWPVFDTCPPPSITSPRNNAATLKVDVDGPEMTKLSKSNRS